MSETDQAEKQCHCGFCLKAQQDVGVLIAGYCSYICNECVLWALYMCVGKNLIEVTPMPPEATEAQAAPESV